VFLLGKERGMWLNFLSIVQCEFFLSEEKDCVVWEMRIVLIGLWFGESKQWEYV